MIRNYKLSFSSTETLRKKFPFPVSALIIDWGFTRNSEGRFFSELTCSTRSWLRFVRAASISEVASENSDFLTSSTVLWLCALRKPLKWAESLDAGLIFYYQVNILCFINCTYALIYCSVCAPIVFPPPPPTHPIKKNVIHSILVFVHSKTS